MVQARREEEKRQEARRAREISVLVAALRTDTFKDPSEVYERLTGIGVTTSPAGRERMLAISKARASRAKVKAKKGTNGGIVGRSPKQGAR